MDDQKLSNLLAFLFFPFCCIFGLTVGVGIGERIFSPPSTESSKAVEQVEPVNKKKVAILEKLEGEIVVIEFEGCEYLYGCYYNFNEAVVSTVFTHKGNCKNPVHTYNKEKE
jgi:hypothetical protein